MSKTLSATATDWREGRRLRAWELAEQGWRQCEIAAALGVTSGAVAQWMRRMREGGGVEALRKRKAPGGPCRLFKVQQAQVLAWLCQGALSAWLSRGVVDAQARGRPHRAQAGGALPSGTRKPSCSTLGAGARKSPSSGRANTLKAPSSSG
jgi:transposase